VHRKNYGGEVTDMFISGERKRILLLECSQAMSLYPSEKERVTAESRLNVFKNAVLSSKKTLFLYKD
jgi:hypothetical protein